MKYQFVKDVEEKEMIAFLKKCSSVSFMQEPSWAYVKNNWGHHLCGVYENGVLVAAGLVLKKSLPFHQSLFYLPRGFVLDFTNGDLVTYFTQELKKLAKEEHAYVITMDPNFCIMETFYREIKNKEPIDTPIHYAKDHEIKHQNLLNAGLKHKGYPKKIGDTLQPRYHMALCLIDHDNKEMTVEDIIKQYRSKLRYYMGSFHEKRGIYFEVTTDVNRLDDFIRLLNCTEKRQHISLRNQDYFKRMMECYKDRVKLLFGHINLTKYLEFLQNNKGKEEDILEVKRLIEERGTDIILSTALMVFPINELGIRCSEYLYAGNNLMFSNLCVSIGMIYEILKLSSENHCHYCNLGGVDGDLNDHLSEFKSKFNPIVLEFIGEYDLPISKVKYHLITTFMPLLKRIYRKLR